MFFVLVGEDRLFGGDAPVDGERRVVEQDAAFGGWHVDVVAFVCENRFDAEHGDPMRESARAVQHAIVFGGELDRDVFAVGRGALANVDDDVLTCPHCGNEMEVDVAWWQRVFSYKAENGETLVRVVPLWVEDYSNGCSAEELKWPASFTSNTYDFDDLRLDFVGALELIGHLYECTKDPALLSIKDELDKKADLYDDMSKDTIEDVDRSEKFETESIEAVIPELKRIIDSHDDVLKDLYIPKN